MKRKNDESWIGDDGEIMGRKGVLFTIFGYSVTQSDIFVGLFAGLIGFLLTSAFSSSPKADPVKTSSFPNVQNMLGGCYATVASLEPDYKDTWTETYTIDTIAKQVQNCMKNTELEPYDVDSNRELPDGVVYATISGCVKSSQSRSYVSDSSVQREFGKCIIDNNVNWRLIPLKVTPEATAESTSQASQGAK